MPPSQDYVQLSIVTFTQLKVLLLKAFIHVRLFKTVTITIEQSPRISLNKGKVAAVETEEVNLLSVAYEVRALPVKLPKPSTDENVNVVFNVDGDDEEVEIDGVDGDDIPPRLNGEDGEDTAVGANNDAPP